MIAFALIAAAILAWLAYMDFRADCQMTHRGAIVATLLVFVAAVAAVILIPLALA